MRLGGGAIKCLLVCLARPGPATGPDQPLTPEIVVALHRRLLCLHHRSIAKSDGVALNSERSLDLQRWKLGEEANGKLFITSDSENNSSNKNKATINKHHYHFRFRAGWNCGQLSGLASLYLTRSCWPFEWGICVSDCLFVCFRDSLVRRLHPFIRAPLPAPRLWRHLLKRVPRRSQFGAVLDPLEGATNGPALRKISSRDRRARLSDCASR